MSPLGLKSRKKDKEPKPAKEAKEPKAKEAKVKEPKAPKQRGVVVEKPKANIYTVMLILALVAILIGCLALYGEMASYNFELKARV